MIYFTGVLCPRYVQQLRSLGRAIETSLSEDPDLAVLEDDVRDFYFQSVAMVGDDGVRERQRSRHHHHHTHDSQQQLPSVSGPVRVVHHQSSPLPCFAGAGLVHHPSAPSRQAEASNSSIAGAVSTRVGVPEEAVEGGTEDVFSTVESCPDADARADRGSTTSTRGRSSGGGSGWLMVGGQKKRSFDGCGVRDTNNNGSGYEFAALIQAFGQKGRPDIGVEGIRRRGRGGEQELAALDDIHGRLKLQPAALELGVRTPTPKGSRWVIGRLRRAGSNDGRNFDVVGGGMYAAFEAAVLSVGDARAAAGRIFSGVGNEQ